jgi:ankyrin repeat protein
MVNKALIFVICFVSYSFSNGDNNGWNPLHHAVYNGNIEIITDELKKHDIQSSTVAGLSPLHIAVKKRDKKAISLLLENNADIEAKDNKGFTSLYYAVVMNDFDTVEFLLEKGADVNTQNNIGNTPMHQVARKDRAEMFGILIKYGAKHDTKNIYGLMPIDFAIDSKNNALIKLLSEQNIK